MTPAPVLGGQPEDPAEVGPDAPARSAVGAAGEEPRVRLEELAERENRPGAWPADGVEGMSLPPAEQVRPDGLGQVVGDDDHPTDHAAADDLEAGREAEDLGHGAEEGRSHDDETDSISQARGMGGRRDGWPPGVEVGRCRAR